MSGKSILYSKRYPINDHIHIEIPTVGEVFEREDEYYGLISLIAATPKDMMVQLDDIGIDFMKINDFELFLLSFGLLKSQDTSMIFGELDLLRLEMAVNQENNTMVLMDKERGVIIDRAIHHNICEAIRKIHRIKRDVRKPANDEAKKFMIKRAKEKIMQRSKRGYTGGSHLEELIIALVNTEQFSYNLKEVLNLTIYQFSESVHQIIKKIDFDNKMYGIYAGTVNAKDLPQQDLNWLTSK